MRGPRCTIKPPAVYQVPGWGSMAHPLPSVPHSSIPSTPCFCPASLRHCGTPQGRGAETTTGCAAMPAPHWAEKLWDPLHLLLLPCLVPFPFPLALLTPQLVCIPLPCSAPEDVVKVSRAQGRGCRDS